MEQKKNPKKDVRRWSLILFQVGLIVVLFVSWRAIENKTYEEKKHEQEEVDLQSLDEDEEMVTEMPENKEPPPPPPKAPEKIDVVEDDEDVEEEDIETAEATDKEPVEVDDVEEVEEDEGDDEPEEVNFQAIEDVPEFPGCEDKDSNDEKKECMSQKVQQFITKRFNTDIAQDLGLSGLTRISVQFTIDENGDVSDVKAKNPEGYDELNEEAKRVVNALPHMKPGKQRGDAVKVVYALPIAFKVN